MPDSLYLVNCVKNQDSLKTVIYVLIRFIIELFLKFLVL